MSNSDPMNEPKTVCANCVALVAKYVDEAAHADELALAIMPFIVHAKAGIKITSTHLLRAQRALSAHKRRRFVSR